MTTLHSTRGRRLLLTATVLTATAVALTGCGRPDDSAGSSSTASIDDSPATGTVEFWAPGADGETLPQLFTDFETANPDIKINVTQVPAADFASKMTAAVASGAVPDIAYITTDQLPALLATQAFSPVPEGLVQKEDFFATSWDASVRGGVQYGVPWYTYSQPLIYRKDLADQAGATAPSDWDDLRAFLEKLKANGVPSPMALSVGYDTFTAQELNVFAHQAGGGLLSDDGKTWTIDTPQNREALQFWAGLIADGLALPDAPTFLDQVPYFSNGTNAATMNGPWFPGWLDDANGAGWSDSHVAMSVPPAGPSGAQSASAASGNLVVFTDAKNPDAAWKLARYMAQPETQVKWYQLFGNLPANSRAWDDPAIADAPNLDVIRQSIEVGTAFPASPRWNEVGKEIASEMEQVVRGNLSPEAALQAAQERADAIGTGNE